MAALIQRIAVQALKTFAKGNSFAVKQQNLINLKALMKQVVPADLVIDESLFSDRSEYVPNDDTAPVTYISVWSDPTYSMGVFILRNRTRLPLHDHPGMDGLVKVIYGSIDVRSFSRVDDDGTVRDQLVRVREELGEEDDDVVVVARELNRGLTVDTSSDVVSLSADEGNFHEIRATDGPAAFLDILSPPYDDPPGPRGCSYYRAEALRPANGEEGPSPPESDLVYLIKIPLPDDYWSDSKAYEGPAVDPYSPLGT